MNESIRAISPLEVRKRIELEGVSDSLLAEIISAMSPAPVYSALCGTEAYDQMVATYLGIHIPAQIHSHLPPNL